MKNSYIFFTCCILSAYLISCSVYNIPTINKDTNTIDMGYGTNNSAFLNIGIDSNFKTKAITNGFESTLASIDHFEIAMSKSVSNPPSAVFSAPDAIVFNLNTNIISPRPIKLLNLKSNTNYYIAARAHSASGNITSSDGTANGTGGGTEGTIDTGSGNEYINVSTNGSVSIVHDGTSVKTGIDTTNNNRIDIELQLMKSIGGNINNNSINYTPGSNTIQTIDSNPIINNKLIDFTVNTETAKPKFKSDVAGCNGTGINGGNFVIVWQSDNQDGFGPGIYGQLYDKNNQPIGSEFLINQTVLGNQENPKVAMADNGSFVVVWQTNQLGNYDIYARRFQANGNPLSGTDGDEFRINTNTTNNQINPVIDSTSVGDFAIAWEGNQNTDFNIYLKKYSNTGTSVLTLDTMVNDASVANQNSPDIALRKNTGEVLIGWKHDRGDGTDIFAKRFDSSLVPLSGNLGKQFRVNSSASGSNDFPSVIYNIVGSQNPNTFCVSWYKNQPELRTQFYDMTTGRRIDEEKVISQTDTTLSIDSSIDQNNNIILGWSGISTLKSIRAFQYDYVRKPIYLNDKQLFSSTPSDLQDQTRISFAKDRYIITWVYNKNVKAKILYYP